MITYLKGSLAHADADGAVIEVGGVGFLVKISEYTLGMLPSPGSEVILHTYMSVKEDDISLYGFISREELAVFKLLLTVSGIGPKGALSILSVLTPGDLYFAVASGDVKAISRAPGVGKRSGERLILELKDKLSAFGQASEGINQALDISRSSGKGSGANPLLKEAAEALISLGYSSSEAYRAVGNISEDSVGDIQDILEQAFRVLGSP